MLSPSQLRAYIVRPTLVTLGMWTAAAEDLVMGTAAQESRLTWIRQLRGGPALGLWQMEPATHDDVSRYVINRPAIRDGIERAAGVVRLDSRYLVGNLPYACALCRVHYWRVPEPLPGAGDVRGLSHYWKRYYNTAAGRGTPDEWIASYHDMKHAED